MIIIWNNFDEKWYDNIMWKRNEMIWLLKIKNWKIENYMIWSKKLKLENCKKGGG